MGKAYPSKWLKAVKKVFSSPSKETISDKDETQKNSFKGTRGTPLDYSKATPLPLPSVAGLMHQEIEQERNNGLSTEDVAELEHSEYNAQAKLNASPPNESSKEDEALREEQAAVQIQRAFRNHLALRGLVRLQALVRGHTVRRQAATTLRAMEALVRVQARVRARRVRMSEEGQAVQQQILQRRQGLGRPKPSEGTWTSGQDTKEKLHIREEAAKKRERAMAYAFSQQLKRSAPKRNMLFIDSEPDQSHWGWSWMDRWMAARPWENRHIEHAKESHQSIASLKSLEAKTKNIKVDGVSLKTARPPPQVPSLVEKSEDKPKKGRRVNGVSGNIPLPLPSPPPSADESLLSKPELQRKAPSPERPALPSRLKATCTPPSTSEGILETAGHESEAGPPSPTGGPSFHHQLTSDHPSSNDCPTATSNEETLEHDPSCSSGSCESEHVNDEDSLTKVHPKGSPVLDHMKTDADLTNTPNTEKGDNGENSVPTSQKSTRNRYMAPTVSAKAKLRASSKTRVEGEESPAKLQKRLSFGSPSVARPKSPNLTAAARSKSISQVRTSLPGVLFKEKSAEVLSPVDSSAHSLQRRKSFGGEPKSATKWR